MLRRKGSSPFSRIFFVIEICGNSAVVARHLAKVDVAGSNPVFRSIANIETDAVYLFCGNSAEVARHLAKVDVAGSNPVFRSN